MKYVVTGDQIETLKGAMRSLSINQNVESAKALTVIQAFFEEIQKIGYDDDALMLCKGEVKRAAVTVTRLNDLEADLIAHTLWTQPGIAPIQPRSNWIQKRLADVKSVIQQHEDKNIPVGDNLREEQRDLERMLK